MGYSHKSGVASISFWTWRCGIGEHDAEAEGVVRAVALVDGDVGRGLAFFLRIAK
jgi:hypothetical protein